MSQEEETRHADLVSQFEDFLNKATEGSPGLSVATLDTMQIVIMIRLRSVFTAEEMLVRAGHVHLQTEHWLAQDDVLVDEKGNPSNPVLAENFEDKADLVAMLEESRQAVTDEAINELLGKEE